METKTGKKVTALLTGVLLLGVMSASVFAAQGMVHEGSMHDKHIMAQMGVTPQQLAKIDSDCNAWMQNALKSQPTQQEKATDNLRYDSEDGWVPGW